MNSKSSWLSLAGVAADAYIKNRPAGEREDSRNPRERKAQAGLLHNGLRVRTLVLQRIGHRNRRSIEGVDAALFPKPLWLDACL